MDIIVVDNGSKALPTNICNKYSVRLAQESIPGPGAARNKGVNVALSDIIAFIDADCVAKPNWLSTIDNLFSETNIHIAGGNVVIAYKNSDKLTMLEAYESVYAFRQEEYIHCLGFSVTANMALRRHVYDDVGPFKGIEVAEDRDWGRRATRMGYRIEYVPDMIVFHPARTSLHQLRAKVDRLVYQAYSEITPGFVSRVRWLVLAMAVAGSPLVEFRRIYLSNRLDSWRNRLLAAGVLVFVCLYRSITMFLIIFGRASKWPYWDLER
jgi:glycosyltransferase involved in cell wall biosynthesis